MVSRLCLDINFACDINNCQKVTGGNNNAILFTCLPFSPKYNGQRIACVLRTTRRLWFKTNPSTDLDLKHLVAFMHNLRNQGNFPIPSILAYDFTHQNHIQSPYMIQERIMGVTLEHEYFKINRGLTRIPRNSHLELRCKYARSVAVFVAAMDQTTLPNYGVFTANVAMPNKSTSVNATFTVSPDQIQGWKISSEPIFHNWINQILNIQLARTRDIFLNLSTDEIFKIYQLRQIGSQMAERGLLTAQPSVLWHSDFYPRNIMMQTSPFNAFLTGVIDWDDARALPRIVTRCPPSFLWGMSLWSTSPNSLLPEEKLVIKDAFDEEMERFCPGYMYDAYATTRVMVRALCMYALLGPNNRHYCEMSFNDLVNKWDHWMSIPQTMPFV
ncbi:hypothetical protein NHQ30_003395 [Ciborinia camelliae]|nr:hypothetical protein NHQ30_003395 [Ciborinia camelliae]